MLTAAVDLGVSEHAPSSVSLRMLTAAIKDPLALFANRSPGKRSGPLAPIKGKAGPHTAPHERVLASVRDLPAQAVENIPPVLLDLPVVVDIPPGALAPEAPPQEKLSPGQALGWPFISSAPVLGVTGGTPPVIVTPPSGETPPPTTPGSPLDPTLPLEPPGSGPPGGTPPPGTPDVPPNPPGPPGGGTTILPEPSSWGLMILGLIAMAFAARGRKARPSTP